MERTTSRRPRFTRTPRRSSAGARSTERYQVFAELACGGMAMVHLGQLLREGGFRRPVAIKQMHAQFARDPEFVRMFRAEACLAAQIRHPNVVPTLDVVAHGGELLLVMDYVEGESLAELMAECAGPMPARIAAAVAHDALSGLHAAHELRDEDGRALEVVHRDVSPGNVLVGRDGLARILDFGIAKAFGRAAATRDGSIKGKVPYMPPEQLWGSDLDRTVDVYAMGVVLWEMLTGRHPFRGDCDVVTMRRIIEEPAVPPSTLAPDAAALDVVVLRALSRDPTKRFPTALEMARAVLAAVPPAGRDEVGEWVQAAAREALDHRAELLRAMRKGELPPASGENPLRVLGGSGVRSAEASAEEPSVGSTHSVASTP